MKSLRFQKLYLCSDLEKSGRVATFDQAKTVIQGENDTGKSCLIKSIYAALGADPYKANTNWQSLKVDLLLDFTIDAIPYKALRTGSFFGLFDGSGNHLWSGAGVVNGIGPRMAELLDFKLTLQDRHGEQVTPPPAYCFLPFYIDQDISWLKTWSSFANLPMFESYKHDVAYFHAGLLPNEYYVAKGAKLEAERTKSEFRVERRALDRASRRLKLREKKELRFDLTPDAFGDQIDALLSQCQALQTKQDAIQRSLSELSSKRSALLEQKDLASNALIELDSDYEFLRDTSDPAIVCPTCGTLHINDFANKFGLVSDVESCRGFLIEVQNDLLIVDQQIAVERTKYGDFTQEIARINATLDQQRGDLKLRDLIEGESERLIESVLESEGNDIDAMIGVQDTLSDEASQTMKSFENRKSQKPIKDQYFGYMKGFLSDLKVPNLPEKTYKRIDCTISETGSDLPRALLAYYLAFIHTMRTSTGSPLCPVVIDTPVQQDQDPENAARMIEMCLNAAPENTQIILGTVGLHGVKFEGHRIRTTEKYRLMSKDDYEQASGYMKPYISQMLGRKG